MRLIHPFFNVSYTFVVTPISQATLILFIKSITIIINPTIFCYLFKFKKVCVNIPQNPLNHFGMFACKFLEGLDLGHFVPVKTQTRDKKFLFIHRYLPSGVTIEKGSTIEVTYLSFIAIYLLHTYNMAS